MAERRPEDPRVQQLVALYREAQARLEALIATALDRGAEGTAEFYRRQLNVVSAFLANLQDATVPIAAAAIGEAYQSTAFAVDALFEPRVAFSFAGPHQAAAEVLADNLVNRLNAAAVTVGRRVEDEFRRVALRETAVGILEGTTRRDVSRALADKLIQEGVTDATTGFVDRRGARWSLERYTEMVARTTTREAASAGTVARLEEVGQDLIQISEHLGSCPICIPFQGKTYSISGRDRRYPQVDRLPPFHPYCRHVAHPASRSLEDFEAALGLGAPV